MNKRLGMGLVAASVAIMVLALFVMAFPPAYVRADTNAALAPFGFLDRWQRVEVQNLEGITDREEDLSLVFAFGTPCAASGRVSAVGKDGQRVLVRTLVAYPYYPRLVNEAGGQIVSCPKGTLFWIGYQQYLLAAERYRKAEAELLSNESQADKDRKAVRRLLDEELRPKN